MLTLSHIPTKFILSYSPPSCQFGAFCMINGLLCKDTHFRTTIIGLVSDAKTIQRSISHREDAVVNRTQVSENWKIEFNKKGTDATTRQYEDNKQVAATDVTAVANQKFERVSFFSSFYFFFFFFCFLGINHMATSVNMKAKRLLSYSKSFSCRFR